MWIEREGIDILHFLYASGYYMVEVARCHRYLQAICIA